MVRNSLTVLAGLSLFVGCESMNNSSKDAACCTDASASKTEMKHDMSKMSKSDLDKCGDECVAKGNAMKADAMKMQAGADRDAAMQKADAMIKDGQECKAKAAKM